MVKELFPVLAMEIEILQCLVVLKSTNESFDHIS